MSDPQDKKLPVKKILSYAALGAGLIINFLVILGFSNANAEDKATMKADIKANTERCQTLKEMVGDSLQEIKETVKENSRDIKKLLSR